MFEPFPAVPGVEPATAATLRRTGFNALAVVADHRVVVHLQGELDMATADHLRQVLDATMTDDTADVVIDLADLTFIDSTGIRVLLSASRRARRQNCSFAMRQPSRVVLKTLRLTGVDEQLNVGSPEHPAGRGLASQ